MGKSGDPAKAAAREARRALARHELTQLELSDAEAADSIGTVMLSVVRDLAVSSLYGKAWHSTGAIPALGDVFSPEFAQQVRQRFAALGPVQHFDFPLYGNMGDALGMLARLLVCCRDIDQLQPLVEAANGQIEQLGITAEHMTDSEYIRHLRNAVLHSHFKVFVDPQDPFQSEFVFIDVSLSGELTAKVVMTNNQLLEVIRVITHEVLEAHLANLPSGKAWVIAL